jgi:hypothetical protein
MVNTYVLKNPCVKGQLDKSVKTKNSLEAAQHFYKNLSDNFAGSLPLFHFTIQKGSSKNGKLYHFEVKENRTENEVDYTINPYSENIKEENVKNFYIKLNDFKEKFGKKDGGAKKKKNSKKTKKSKKSKKNMDSSDSDKSESDSLSSESSNYYKRVKSYLPTTQPIYYWWYDPYLYNLDKLYIPNFYSYVTPYIELSLKQPSLAAKFILN